MLILRKNLIRQDYFWELTSHHKLVIEPFACFLDIKTLLSNEIQMAQ